MKIFTREDLDLISDKVLKSLNVSPIVFNQSLKLIAQEIALDQSSNFKLLISSEKMISIIESLPMAEEISSRIFEHSSYEFSSEQKLKIKKQISYYLIGQCFFNMKQNLLRFIPSIIYSRTGKLRLGGFTHKFAKKISSHIFQEKFIAKNDESMDELQIVSKLDYLFGNSIRLLPELLTSKIGRPKDSYSGQLLSVLKNTIQETQTNYMKHIEEIVFFLKEHYPDFFQELSYENETNIKKINRYNEEFPPESD